MTRACALETNKLEKKRAAVFQVVRHCRRVRHNPFNPAVLRPPNVSPRLRPVVEAEEDGGEFKLPNSTNFRLRWIQGVRRTFFQNKDWQEAFSFTKSSLIKASCRPESSKRIAAGFFVQSGSMFTSQYTQRVAANRVSALSQFSSLLR